MRLATIEIDGRPSAAVIRADGAAVVLAAAAGAAAGLAADDPALSGSLAALIAGGPAALASARAVAAASEAGGGIGVVAPATVRLLAPLPRPGKNVFCVGRNYAEHIAEGERAQNRQDRRHRGAGVLHQAADRGDRAGSAGADFSAGSPARSTTRSSSRW